MKIKERIRNTSRHMKIFIGFIVILVATIATLSALRADEESEQTNKPQPTYREVDNHSIHIKSLAEVTDSSVVTIYAQTSGIVTSILKEQGEYLSAGSPFLQVSSTYSGGSAAAVQASIAQKQLENYKDTYDTQLNTIELQRELAQKQSQNQEELRELGRASAERTEDIIDTNQQSIDEIEAMIDVLSSQNGNEEQIQSLTQTLNQLEATQAQLISSNNANKYQSSEDNPPAGLANLQRDLAMKQFELQEFGLDLNGEILRLQAQLAGITASLFRPVSPFSGEIIDLYVNEYDAVSPGIPLATVKSNESTVTLTTYLPYESIEIIDKDTTAKARFDKYTYNATVTYVATYPTKGDLYAVTITLDSVSENPIPTNSFIEVEFSIPSSCNEIVSVCYLPLDAVTVTDEQTYISYVVNGELVSIAVDLLSLVGDSAKISGDISGKTIVLPFAQ